MSSKQPLMVEVLRGPVVESHHQVMGVIVNEVGYTVHSWGNTGYMTMPRSAIKMLQALPLIESGASDKFALDDKFITLACGSHRGEKEHLTALAQFMEKTGVKEDMLACGPHWPLNEAAKEDLIRKNAKPTALCNNCAGKHIAMIATCLHAGENPAGYEKYEHNAQKRIRRVLTETMRVDHSKVPHGIDGCGIPTFSVPLSSMAVGMSSLINPKETQSRKFAASKILSAVRHNPFFLAGSDDFSTAVIEKTQGRAIIKGGAEGVYCGVIPEKGMAFAVKAADGASRAASVAAAHILLRYGGLTEVEFKALQKFTTPVISTWRGDIVGQVRVAKEV
jgi:L-asparaginase II